MNCGSCIHLEQDCEYQEFKKLMEYHIYDNELEDILNVVCNKCPGNVSRTFIFYLRRL